MREPRGPSGREDVFDAVDARERIEHRGHRSEDQAPALGGRAAYLGKVSGDQLGDVFAHDIQAAGVSYDVRRTAEAATGRCLIFVTPDAQRTMNTYLGAASLVDPDDIIEETVAASLVLYMEGYLWDPPLAKQAFLKAARVAHDAGRPGL